MAHNSTFATSDVIASTILPLSTAFDEDLIRIITTISYGVVCQSINLFGMATNIINIICFVKQGFNDSVNVTLLALSISDFGCLLTMIWCCICLVPLFQELDLPFDPFDMQYLTTAMPHIVLTRITSCITALITLQRCLCVIMPLKFGHLLSPERAVYIIVCIFVLLVACITPLCLTSRYAMTFSPQRNRTILSLVFTDNRQQLDQISFILSNVVVPFTAFLMIIICMTLMVVTLQKQAQWRKSCSSANSKDTIAVRDRKLTKMVVMISVLFVVCFTPSVMMFVIILLVPEFSVGGEYETMLSMTYSFVAILESTNSATNIFIYHSMSSRYRAIFRQLFFKKYKDNGVHL